MDHTKNLLNGYKIKKAKINPQNYDDGNCSQYSFTVALNHKRIKNHPERISNIKTFINPNDWKGIDILPHSKDWKKLEQNNMTIGLNILYVPYNTEQIELACKSKYNFERGNQVNLLMITDGDK